MLQLSDLIKLKKTRKRVGRGGDRGGTSGKGHKGQRSRSGFSGELKAFFEGGQMPLPRRLPARGFNNFAKKDVRIVNIKSLEAKFQSGDVVDRESLKKVGILKGRGTYLIKILGVGKLTKALNVKVDKVSKAAKQIIEAAGGKVYHESKEISSGINS